MSATNSIHHQKTRLRRGAGASRRAAGRRLWAERAEPRSPGLRPLFASGTRQPPPRPLLPPSGGRRRSFLPPLRGLLLTLRKTPDVRGWLSATGGSGFPAPRPGSPPQLLAPAGRSPLGCPAPRRPAATRAPRLPLARTPSPAARAAGPAFPPGSSGLPPAAGPATRHPRRGPDFPAHPPHHDTAGVRAQCEETRSHIHLGEADPGAVRARFLAVPGEVAVQSKSQSPHGLEVGFPRPSESPPCEGCWFHGLEDTKKALLLKFMAQGVSTAETGV